MLRQDVAFHDAYDIAGIAGQVGNNTDKYRRGMGRKFGEGIQYTATGVGGMAYSLYSDWRVSLVIIATLPFVSLAGIVVMHLNQSKAKETSESYRHAGGIAYDAVSSIKTVLSLNGVAKFVQMYRDATLEAFNSSISFIIKQGFANGTCALWCVDMLITGD